MSEDDVLKVGIGELFDNFRGALIAMLPFADRAKMSYQDEGAHRDWERLSECMFDAFVRGPIDADRNRGSDELPIARYDIDFEDYREMSWLALGADSFPTTAVVRLLSLAEPFDTIQVVDIDPTTLRAGPRRTVPWHEANLVLLRRRVSDHTEVVTQIEAVE